jgi:DNA-directed RNA polymerase subunit RPC12/RpoP
MSALAGSERPGETTMDNQNELKCVCPICGGHIQFPIEEDGQEVECPHCGKLIILKAQTEKAHEKYLKRIVIVICYGVSLLLVYNGFLKGHIHIRLNRLFMSKEKGAVADLEEIAQIYFKSGNTEYKYDVQKTESLVSPFAGKVSYSYQIIHDPADPERNETRDCIETFLYQNGKWVFNESRCHAYYGEPGGSLDADGWKKDNIEWGGWHDAIKQYYDPTSWQPPNK